MKKFDISHNLINQVARYLAEDYGGWDSLPINAEDWRQRYRKGEITVSVPTQDETFNDAHQLLLFIEGTLK